MAQTSLTFKRLLTNALLYSASSVPLIYPLLLIYHLLLIRTLFFAYFKKKVTVIRRVFNLINDPLNGGKKTTLILLNCFYEAGTSFIMMGFITAYFIELSVFAPMM